MYAPRRHARLLLLPPGWVALGFLLLLGCQVLLRHERQLQMPNVMQLTMPVLKSDSTNMHLVLPAIYRSINYLDTVRHWQNADLSGDILSDFINISVVGNAIKNINADTAHEGGVRIRFHQRATYGSLIAVLDIMNRLNQKKYWLDIHHKPTTFYAITDKPLPASARVSTFICGTNSYMESHTTVPIEPFFQQILARLWQQAWRPSILLFTVIIALNIYRLRQFRRLAR